MFCHVCALKMLFCFDMLLAKPSQARLDPGQSRPFQALLLDLFASFRFGQDGKTCNKVHKGNKESSSRALGSRVHVDQSI